MLVATAQYSHRQAYSENPMKLRIRRLGVRIPPSADTSERAYTNTV